MTSLVLPQRFAASARRLGMRVRPLLPGPKPQAKVGLREHPGRPVGKPAGSYVDELASLSKCILLCFGCQHQFDHTRHQYYKDRRFPSVQGRCDGCRQWVVQAKLYIHEQFLADPGGRIRSGQSWTPV